MGEGWGLLKLLEQAAYDLALGAPNDKEITHKPSFCKTQMIVLKPLWATGLSQNMGTPYLAVISPAYSSSKEQGAEAPVSLPGGSTFHTRSSVWQEPELS